MRINELPSIKTFLLISKISEKIKSSKTLSRSENLTIAYELPFCVFFSWTLRTVAAIFIYLDSLIRINSE